MMTRTSLVSLAAIALSLGAAGCATPDVSAHGLRLQRVVIYRNGVGYFERQGKIDVPEVTFRVRHERVGDFLATLAVIERGGSSVRAASFPVTTKKKKGQVEGGVEVDEDDDEDRRYEVLLKPPPGKPEAKKDPLDTVRLSLDGKEHDLQVGYVAETPVWRPSYRLVIDSATPAAPGAAAKPSKADLQAWGIVQNLSGEDWKGVRLSLVAGAPLAFQATLEKAVIPPRPVVTDQGEVIASVPTSETSLATRSEPPPAPPPPPAMAPMPSAMDMPVAEKAAEEQDAKKDAVGRKRAKAASPKGGGRGGGRPMGQAYAGAPDEAAMMPAAPAPQPVYRPEVAPSMPRNVSALAAVAVDAGTTRYDLPFTVDVPNESATMVLLVAKEVPGEAIFLFAPDGGVPASHAHPFRVARFTNDTQGLLEKGPIAVFEKGAFLGQGMVDPLPPGATATVPFALERALAVESSRSENEQGARLAKIEAGQIEIERDWVTHTKYTIKSGSDVDARMLVKHPRMAGTRLVDAPKGTEDNVGTGSALVPVQVPKRTTATLDVDERRVLRRGVDWLSELAAEAVKAYVADPRADQGVVGPLRAAWEARDKLRAALDEQAKLSGEKGQLESQSDDLRRNLKAIEKNKSADGLRKDLTDRLARASARLDEITKRLIVVEMNVSEQQIRFRDLVTNIKMLKPLPPA